MLEGLDQELLGLLAHGVDLAGDPLVHLLLPLGGVLALKFLGDLAYLGFSSNLVMWLIYFFVLSRISKLIFNVRSALLTSREHDEEVSEASVAEEPLLCLLGVLVHGVSDHLEVDGSTLDHLLDIFLLEVVAEHDAQHGGGELQDLRRVHGALQLLGITLILLTAEVEEVLAEVVSLLEEGLLPEVVFDVFEVGVGDRELGRFVLQGQEELFK